MGATNMKIGSPKAMRQEPSLHDWDYENAANKAEDQELSEDERNFYAIPWPSWDLIECQHIAQEGGAY